MKQTIFLGGSLVFALAAPAVAQPGGGRTPQPIDRAAFEQRIERRFQMADANGDGYITRDEAQSAMNAMQRFGGGRGGGGDRLAGSLDPQAFDAMDTDHDGRVSLAEAKAAALQRFDAMDTNHDGVLSPEERQAARGTQPQR